MSGTGPSSLLAGHAATGEVVWVWVGTAHRVAAAVLA